MGQYLDYRPSGVKRHRILATLGELLDDRWERRGEQRLPYFGPVSVGLPAAPEVNFSAFARDLSLVGIGLIHLMPLDPGEVLVSLPLPSGRLVHLRTEILWCRDYNDGWFASGGQFQDVVPLNGEEVG
jgi:hypothetical protein